MSSDFVLYRFFNDQDRLLYVGLTNNIRSRVGDHRRDKPWWKYAVTIRLERYDSLAELARAELAAIETEHPRYNIRHALEHETINVPIRAEQAAPDANTFGTTPPRQIADHDDRLRWPESYPCPRCCGRTFRYGGPHGQPMPVITEPVRCADCGETWEHDDWLRMNGQRL